MAHPIVPIASKSHGLSDHLCPAAVIPRLLIWPMSWPRVCLTAIKLKDGTAIFKMDTGFYREQHGKKLCVYMYIGTKKHVGMSVYV